MPTKNEIITNLYTGKNFTDCINKMEPAHLRDDLRQEVITIVCGWTDEKVIDLHKKGVLEFYVVRVILNQIQSKSSPFAKTYRQTFIEFDNHEKPEDHPVEDREIKEAIEVAALDQINRLHWYSAELLRLYMKLGNFRAIEKLTGIPFISCYKDIKKSLALIKERVVMENKPLFAKGELK